MDLSVATGVDGISCRLLKAACPAICPSLAYLINRSLFSGIVPQKWKIARVTPIFKGGDRDQITNYRPISVLPLVSKVLEMAVNNQLRNFLGKNNFFAKFVRVGAPQGSIPGPLLFTIYINSLPTSITVPQCKINMYADDTIIMFTGTSSTFIKDMTTGLELVRSGYMNINLL